MTTAAESSGSSRPTKSLHASRSVIPGPTSTEAASAAKSNTSVADSGAIAPSSVSASPRTNASGSATATCAAMLETVATCSLPAPDRRAASAANSTAPGVCVLPPMISVRPRASLPPSGTGSGHSRSIVGVTTTASAGDGGGIGLLGDRLVELREVLDVVEGLQGEATVSQVVSRHRSVGDLLLCVDLEDLGLGQVLQHEAEQHGHRLVRDDEDAPLRVALLEHLGHAADPQSHVGPALPAGWPVVELAEVLAAGRLVREPLPDAAAGEAVEDTEVALAQPLVPDELEVEPGGADGDPGCGRSTGVRRAEHRVR